MIKKNHLSEETNQNVSQIARLFFILPNTEACLLLNTKLQSAFEWLDLQKFHFVHNLSDNLALTETVTQVQVHETWKMSKTRSKAYKLV